MKHSDVNQMLPSCSEKDKLPERITFLRGKLIVEFRFYRNLFMWIDRSSKSGPLDELVSVFKF